MKAKSVVSGAWGVATRPLVRRWNWWRQPRWWTGTDLPWERPHSVGKGPMAVCNICHWAGAEFLGTEHVESAMCPRCGSVARDRFLLFCFLDCSPHDASMRVLETSPRLGREYRRMMRSLFHYTSSDFDLSAHRGDIRIDLQDIALPGSSVDVVLTPHVLEHVPDTDRALREIHRVLAPDGAMYLQIPLQQGVTARPTEPEFHGDNTPVHFRFGWDLIASLEAAGFDVEVLVMEEFAKVLRGENSCPEPDVDGFDVPSMIEHAPTTKLRPLVDIYMSKIHGFRPERQFVTFRCVKR